MRVSTTNRTLKFHVNPVGELIGRLLGLELSDEVGIRLGSLAAWLVDEGIRSGGIGPNEAAIVVDRHILGSAAFAFGFSEPPSSCWDLGSGIGLPGLVLALIWPGTRITLIDSSQKRCDLARRGSRLLEVDVEVLNRRFEDLSGQTPGIVSRGAMPAELLRPTLERLLAPGGTAVVSGSSASAPAGFSLVEIPQGVLHTSPRLLMMRSQ